MNEFTIRKSRAIIALWIFFIPKLLTAEPVSVDLDQSFHAALKHSTQIESQTEQIKQTEEQYKQAIGTMLPNVSGVASFVKQQKPLGAGSPENQPLAKIMITQPLFRGFSDFYALKQSKLLKDSQLEAQKTATRNLFTNIAQIYFNILAIESDLINYKQEMASLDERIQDLNKFIKIGRSRQTEVLTVKATRSTLQAQVAKSESTLDVARETFSFFTGLDVNTSLKKIEYKNNSIQIISEALVNMDSRSEIKNAKLISDSAQESIKIARTGYLPSLDFVGNYYLDRVSANKDVKWDVGISMSMPIFDGGITSSKVEEALSQKKQAELSITQSKEQIEQEIKINFKNIQSSLKQENILKQAVEINKENLNVLRTDYQHGLCKNIDVLQAITSYEEAKRSYEWAQYSTTLNSINYEVSTGNYHLSTDWK